MIQAIVKKGKVLAEKIPAPVIDGGFVLIKVINSCISGGTESSGVNESSKSLLKKALEQPEKIKKVIGKIKCEGISEVYHNLKEKENAGFPTGYSISGVIIGKGKDISKFKVGDKVAAAGAGYANHAEYVNVPENLIVSMPENLDFISASTVTLGAIAMQGIRRANLNLGEYCAVFGTGILGLLTIQMLKAAGIRIIAIDIDDSRLELAKEYGAEFTINPNISDLLKTVTNITGGFGTDVVIFTAATNKSEPLSLAFNICKKKGKVVLVGSAGNEIKREDIYSKELDFLVSTSYGPGRYDKNYEENGNDYPYSYVRWTENRNMEEYLRLLSLGLIKIDKMVSKIYPIEKVTEAFESLLSIQEKPLLLILDYENHEIDNVNNGKKYIINNNHINKDIINAAIVGLGSFSTNVHLPNLQKLKDKYKIYAVMDRTGYTAKAIANKYEANYATTDYNEILNDANIDLVIICTRHDSHTELTLKALKAGKNVFVEKPLATTIEELNQIESFYSDNSQKVKPVLMVGFNRRFSQYAREIKKHTAKRINPLFIHYRMNAGYIPYDHWVHEHGGRIVGEACHIIDLMTFFTESEIENVSVESLTNSTYKLSSVDNKAIILKYLDGSVCCIDYFANGSRDLSKEYMEVHFDNKSIIMDDYKSLKGYSLQINEINTKGSEKGHIDEFDALYNILKNNSCNDVLLSEIVNTTRASLIID